KDPVLRLSRLARLVRGGEGVRFDGRPRAACPSAAPLPVQRPDGVPEVVARAPGGGGRRHGGAGWPRGGGEFGRPASGRRHRILKGGGGSGPARGGPADL